MKDSYNNICTTQTLCTVDGRQPGHGSLDLEILFTPFSPSTNNDDGDNIGNDTSLRPAKRQRPVSPHCEPNLGPINMLQNEEARGGIDNINDNGLEKSEDDDISSKRQKLTLRSGEVALNGHSEQLRRPPKLFRRMTSVMAMNPLPILVHPILVCVKELL